MKEHPILFTGAMVRAILEGRKTQTRRPIKAPAGCKISCYRRDGDPDYYDLVAVDEDNDPIDFEVKRPFAVSDRLWVRETFASFKGSSDPCSPRDALYAVMPDGAQKYRDGTSVAGLATYAPGAFDGIKWRPSIHMPRWASRLTLEVTDIRPERVQSITEADAMAEGIECDRVGIGHLATDVFHFVGDHFADAANPAFARLWDSIYGESPLAWKHNPWTWATTFKLVEKGGSNGPQD